MSSLRQTLSRLWQPETIQDWRTVWKKDGFGGLVKQKGWKVVVAVVLFYLIRDSILYLVIPYLAARGLLGC